MKAFLKILAPFMALGTLLVLAGCETTSSSGGSPLLQTATISEIDVRYSGTRFNYHVHDIDKEYKATLAGTPQILRSGKARTPEGQDFLKRGITAHIQPYMSQYVANQFTGANPLRMVVDVKSVYVPSRLRTLTGLDGVRVFQGGFGGVDKFEGETHLVAAVSFEDPASGIVIERYEPVRVNNDGTGTIWTSDRGPILGKSKRLSILSYDFARRMAERLKQNVGRVADEPLISITDTF